MTMTDSTLLDDLRRHRLDTRFAESKVCAGCGGWWPCDAARALAALAIPGETT